MQRNGRKLADILNRTIPGQAVVKLGHDADIDTSLPRLGNNACHHTRVTRCREKYLIGEILTSQLEHLVEGTEYVAGQGWTIGIDSGDLHVALEAVAQVANAIQMLAHCLANPAGTHNDNVAH